MPFDLESVSVTSIRVQTDGVAISRKEKAILSGVRIGRTRKILSHLVNLKSPFLSSCPCPFDNLTGNHIFSYLRSSRHVPHLSLSTEKQFRRFFSNLPITSSHYYFLLLYWQMFLRLLHLHISPADYRNFFTKLGLLR